MAALFWTAVDVFNQGVDGTVSWLEAHPDFGVGASVRLYGVVCLIAFTSYLVDSEANLGPSGLVSRQRIFKELPVNSGLPLLTRLWYFPSLFHLNQSLAFIRLVLVAGLAAALYIIVGGPYTRVAFAYNYIVHLSLASHLPWDMLIAEWSFVLTFLGPVPVLGSAGSGLAAVGMGTAPTPLVSFLLRLLTFRLMFGFGRVKFEASKTTTKDSLYNKNFFVNQPIPSPVAWWGFNLLPNVVHRASVALLFSAEIIGPFFMFPRAGLRLIGAGLTIGLMLSIQAGGNFGYFNIATASLAFNLLDISSSITDVALVDTVSDLSWAGAVLVAYTGLVLLMSPLCLLLNSWVANGYSFWPGWRRTPPALQAYMHIHKVFTPWRVCVPYGVFPPKTLSPQRFTVVYEGSHDGKEWKRWSYKFLPSGPKSPPVFVAPHHPRLDHMLYYEGPGSFPRCAIGFNFAYPLVVAADSTGVLVNSLLQGARNPVYKLFKTNPFPDPDRPPKWVRVQVVCLQPTTPAHLSRTGEYWTEKYAGVHQGPRSMDCPPPLPAAPPVEVLDSESGGEWRRMGWKLSPVTPGDWDAAWELVAFLRKRAAAHTGTDIGRAGDDVRIPLTNAQVRSAFTHDSLTAVVGASRKEWDYVRLVSAVNSLQVLATQMLARLERVYFRRDFALEEDVQAAQGVSPLNGHTVDPAWEAEWADMYRTALPEAVAHEDHMGGARGHLGTLFDVMTHAYFTVVAGGMSMFEAVVANKDDVTSGTVPAWDTSGRSVGAIFRDSNTRDLNVTLDEVEAHAWVYKFAFYDDLARDVSKSRLIPCMFPPSGGDWYKNQRRGPLPGGMELLKVSPQLPAWNYLTKSFQPHLVDDLSDFEWEVSAYGEFHPVAARLKQE